MVVCDQLRTAPDDLVPTALRLRDSVSQKFVMARSCDAVARDVACRSGQVRILGKPFRISGIKPVHGYGGSATAARRTGRGTPGGATRSSRSRTVARRPRAG